MFENFFFFIHNHYIKKICFLSHEEKTLWGLKIPQRACSKDRQFFKNWLKFWFVKITAWRYYIIIKILKSRTHVLKMLFLRHPVFNSIWNVYVRGKSSQTVTRHSNNIYQKTAFWQNNYSQKCKHCSFNSFRLCYNIIFHLVE